MPENHETIIANLVDALKLDPDAKKNFGPYTPGFIVNRVARPFYGEALRIYEEGFADFATIDWGGRVNRIKSSTGCEISSVIM